MSPVIRLLPLFACLLISGPGSTAALIQDVIEVIQIIGEVAQEVQTAWEFIDGVVNTKTPKEKQLMSDMGVFSKKLDSIQQSVETNQNSLVAKFLEQTPQKLSLELLLKTLAGALATVNSAEHRMRIYSSGTNQVEKLTLENFALWAVSSEEGSIWNMQNKILDLISPNEAELGILNPGLMNLLVTTMKESNTHICELQQSPHQLLLNMYNTIALTEIKAYKTMQYSWMLLKVYGHGNFTAEANDMKQRFQARSTIILTAVKDAMEETSREMWRCDPSVHTEGSTYVAVGPLFQGYVENEVDMNTDDTCMKDCSDYVNAKNHGCFKNKFCSKQPVCKGNILKCNYIDADMTICPAEGNSSRRYNWIEYENGVVYGKKRPCPRATTVDSWWRVAYHCTYCFCICDEADVDSDRYISMLETKSDVTKNRVITGLRFVKENRIIYIQISEGILEAFGKINQASVEWRPIKTVDTSKPNGELFSLSEKTNIVDLDDLEGPQGHVLTGVRFRMFGSHVNFEIQTTPFNFKTGKLDISHGVWVSNDNTDTSENPRTEVKLIDPDIPTNTASPSIPDSVSDQYIKFTHSSIEKDVAQTTVPFLDVQNVIPAQAIPLSGAGIYHKGQKFFGGFIAPKIFTYDFSQHMEIAFPDVDKKNDQ